jgi:uncharacterized membrane protein
MILINIPKREYIQGGKFMPEINEKTSSGLTANVAGLLCYLFGWVTGLIFLFMEKDSKFVRFHAIQSIIVFGAISIAQFILWILFLIPFLGWIIGFLVWIGTVILWVFLMYKAYQGEKYKLPIAGNIAEKQVEQMSK